MNLLPHQIHPTTRAVYEAIEEFYSLNGHSPGIRGICQMTGLKSKATVCHHIDHLIDLGWLRKEPGQYTLVPIRQPRVYYVRRNAEIDNPDPV